MGAIRGQLRKAPFKPTRVFVYCGVELKSRKHIVNILLGVVPEVQIESFESLRELESSLLMPATGIRIGQGILVVAPGDEVDLFELLTMRELLFETTLILILPDRDEAMVSKGHLLYPRFLSYADAGPEEVRLVLQRMLLRINRNHRY